MMTDAQYEIVADLAHKHGIDPRFLAALQQAENGPMLEDGSRGFGVLAKSAKVDFETNGDWAARTIRRTLARYVLNQEEEPTLGTWWDEERQRYSAAFIRYFSSGGEGYPGYAQVGVANDPTGLNAHHYDNLTRLYDEECV